jgi:hypothetical protein
MFDEYAMVVSGPEHKATALKAAVVSLDCGLGQIGLS